MISNCCFFIFCARNGHELNCSLGRANRLDLNPPGSSLCRSKNTCLLCFVPADKTPEQQAEEEQILQQLIEVVDMRDSLVLFLEEKRLKEISEEQEAFCMKEAKRHSKTGAQVHWA